MENLSWDLRNHITQFGWGAEILISNGIASQNKNLDQVKNMKSFN